MVKSPIISTEILQRSKKKNVIFEKVATPHFISTSIFILVVILVSILAAKMTAKTIKPVW